jgi:hypothetical protein
MRALRAEEHDVVATVVEATRLLDHADADLKSGGSPAIATDVRAHRRHADAPRAAERRGRHLLVARFEDVEAMDCGRTTLRAEQRNDLGGTALLTRRS